jgi:hypothetical protein
MVKYKIKQAGLNYYNIEVKKNNKFQIYFWAIMMVVAITFSLVINFHILLLIYIGGLILWLLSDIIKHKLFSHISGIYENGIIDDNNFIEWNMIHSYKINENNIFGYLQNGKLFEYYDIEKIKLIDELFKKNKIMKRE